MVVEGVLGFIRLGGVRKHACILRVVLTAFLFSTGAGSGSAALIALDLNAPGDGLLTRDTESAVEWLDLAHSAGFSYNEIESGIGGFKGLGFRHATEAEVAALMAQFGFPESWQHPEYFDAIAFVRTLSCTALCGVDGQGNVGVVDTEGVDPNTTLALGVFTYIDPMPPFATLTRQTTEVDAQTDFIGHYLVRSVPEPSPIVPLVLAALACAACRSA